MNSTARELQDAVEARRAGVGVLGLGYVGLPLALAFAESGFEVLGFDVDPHKVASLDRGDCYIAHLDGERVRRLRDAGRLAATADFDRLAEPDVLLICVPTPLTPGRDPDLGHLERSAGLIAARLRRGQLVVLESTTYPGTTDEVLKPRLEESGLRCGEDFFLAYSPEREDPGNRRYGLRQVPKVVGGVDAASARLARSLYERAGVATVPVSSARVAEASKLTENVFRAVNIALANELKQIYDALGIDVWEVLDAAATKPFGYMRFDPGPGWGGHCIPIDPFYLAWKAGRAGHRSRFIELAGEINVEMPAYVVAKLEAGLAARGKSLAESAILILGVAYKPDVADPRESPAFDILARLTGRGTRVAYHDPHIAELPVMRSWSHLPRLRSVPLTPETLAAHDAAVLVTHHSGVDYELVLRHAPLVVDTRGVYRSAAANLIQA